MHYNNGAVDVAEQSVYAPAGQSKFGAEVPLLQHY